MTVDRAADPHIGVQSRLLGNRSKTQMGKNSPSIDLSHGEDINPTTSKNILWYIVKPMTLFIFVLIWSHLVTHQLKSAVVVDHPSSMISGLYSAVYG
jgi:hypothetical protein